MSDGRFDDAAGIYQDMLRTLPNEPGLLMNLGMALAMGGREAEAVAPLERAIKLKPESDAGAPLPWLELSRAREGRQGRRAARARGGGAARRCRAAPDARAGLRRRRPSSRCRRSAAQDHRARARQLPGGWYALGQAYNAITQDALATFDAEAARVAVAAAARCRRPPRRWPADRRLCPLPGDARAAAVDGQHPRFDRANLRADGPR